jgi:hypothetical protein
MSVVTAARAGRARVAVTAMFALGGLVCASWISRTPAMRDTLALSEYQLGLLLLCLSSGAVTALPLAGPLVTPLPGRAAAHRVPGSVGRCAARVARAARRAPARCAHRRRSRLPRPAMRLRKAPVAGPGTIRSADRNGYRPPDRPSHQGAPIRLSGHRHGTPRSCGLPTPNLRLAILAAWLRRRRRAGRRSRTAPPRYRRSPPDTSERSRWLAGLRCAQVRWWHERPGPPGFKGR